MVEFIGYVTDDHAGPEGGWVVISPSLEESAILLAAARARMARPEQAPDMVVNKLAYSNATLRVRDGLRRGLSAESWQSDLPSHFGVGNGYVNLEYPGELDELIGVVAANTATSGIHDDLLDIRSRVMRGDVTDLADLE